MARAPDEIAVERILHPCDRRTPVRSVGRELGDHRVVEHRDLGSLPHARVDPHVRAVLLRRAVAYKPPDSGQEVAARILGIDARLDGPAIEAHVFLGERQLLAVGDADHLLDQVQPGHHLGHRMLDLEPRVHLEKIEVAVLVDDELDRARGAVIDRRGERTCLRPHRRAGLGIQEWRRRLLDHLLVAALNRTLPLAEVDHVAIGVGEDLDLDMARLLDKLLDEDTVVAEAGTGLVLGRAEALVHFVGRIGDAHPLAPAAGGRLDHDGIADVVGNPDRFRYIGDGVHMARHGADARRVGELLGLDLVAHRRDRAGRWADEGDAFSLEGAREVGILRQEAVTRMHRVSAGIPDRREYPVHHQIAFGCRRRPDVHRLVGHPDVQRSSIGVRIDRHRRNAHVAGRANDAARDFAAVGDENLLKHATNLREHVAVRNPGIRTRITP